MCFLSVCKQAARVSEANNRHRDGGMQTKGLGELRLPELRAPGDSSLPSRIKTLNFTGVSFRKRRRLIRAMYGGKKRSYNSGVTEVGDLSGPQKFCGAAPELAAAAAATEASRTEAHGHNGDGASKRGATAEHVPCTLCDKARPNS